MLYAPYTTTTHPAALKTTVHLDAAVKRKITGLAKRKVIKNQTAFINEALVQHLEKLEKDLRLQSLKEKLQHLPGYTSPMRARDALDAVRHASTHTAE